MGVFSDGHGCVFMKKSGSERKVSGLGCLLLHRRPAAHSYGKRLIYPRLCDILGVYFSPDVTPTFLVVVSDASSQYPLMCS